MVVVYERVCVCVWGGRIPTIASPRKCGVHATPPLLKQKLSREGVYRAAPIRAAPRANRRELKAIYKTHIDIVHIRREEHGRLFTVFGDGGKEQTPSSGSQQGSQGGGGERGTQDVEGEEGLQIMDNTLQQQVRAKEQALKVWVVGCMLFDSM